MTTAPTINLLIVDDHDLLREGIVARLSDVSTIKIIGQGCNGKEAVELCKEHEPDVLLMDISMPEMNGLEAAKEIKLLGIKTRILFLSIYDDNEYVQEALRIGASGFVLKDVSKPEMLNAIKSVSQGAIYLGPKVAASLQNTPSDTQKTPTDYGLTNREKQVLSLIAEGHLNKEIAYRLDISIRTVESHRSVIRDKTGGGNAATLAKIARQLGL
ncbi:response regulator transcription factor [Amylibacter sp. SFDW26]|uniref:response regulator n=1 Tax=Amylibacter sp. SFDW26 TaxID=2652722 RepID=UPI001261E575|nr:response regulator transcription factor [Amylibacter sp. SFDW26]KAB7615258.1 response regulator transcription factor [Amylibacter sp. SFDW26]